MIEQLFFQLIRVAVGTQDTLSRPPSAQEWSALYDMAKKQSLVGICFAGVQRLSRTEAPINHKPYTINLQEVLYLQWMGMAAKIQQRNEVVNWQCVELLAKLKGDGFNCCLLKGQAAASLYHENLRALRQPGDIDIWLWSPNVTEVKLNKDLVENFANAIDKQSKTSEHHVHLNYYSDTEVELHYIPTYLYNPWANKVLSKWLWDHRDTYEALLGVSSPSIEFNIIFMMSHMFRHYMNGGVGLRQLMDFYFVLNSRNGHFSNCEFQKILRQSNLLKFSSAVMWLLHEVFYLDEKLYISEPNRRYGIQLLNNVLSGGNFGKYDEKSFKKKRTHFKRFIYRLKDNIKLSLYYPGEALCIPISLLKEYYLKRF